MPKGIGSHGASTVYITPTKETGEKGLVGISNQVEFVGNAVEKLAAAVKEGHEYLTQKIDGVSHLTGKLQGDLREQKESLEQKVERLGKKNEEQLFELARFLEERLDRIEGRTLLGLLRRLWCLIRG